MYHFASSAVSTVSKSFPDLLNFWSSREDLKCKSNIQPFKFATTVQKRLACSISDENSSKQVAAEHTSSKDISSDAEFQSIRTNNKSPGVKVSASRHLPTETSSLYSYRESNKNIEFLTSNRNTVSFENICQEEITKRHHSRSDGYGGERIPFESQSAVFDSPEFTKSDAHNSELLDTDKVCKEKQLLGKNDARKGYHRSSKQFKPKSESRYESNLKRGTKKKPSNTELYEDLSDHRRERQLFYSSYSSFTDQDDDVHLPVAVREERSLSFPSTDSHQNVVHIEKSSNIVVNTSNSIGTSVASPSERLSFPSVPSRGPMSLSSGDSRSYSVRNAVADLTKSALEERKKSNISVETKRLVEAKRRLFYENREFLILTGRSGDGLTTLGYDLLLEFPTREHFIVMEPGEVLPCIIQAGEKPVILFADDVFGTTYFDDKRFEEWRRLMGRIFGYLKRCNAILIIALRIELTEESKCKQFCDFHQDSILNISEPVLQLDFKEMRSMLHQNIISQRDILKIEICKTKKEEIIKDVEGISRIKRCLISEETIDAIAKTALPSGFPREVARFLKNVDNIKRGEEFFQCPTVDMYTEIDKLRTSNKEMDHAMFLALTAVFVYRCLEFDILELHSLHLMKSEKELKSYMASCSGKHNKLGQFRKPPAMINVLQGFSKRFNLSETIAGSVKKGVKLLLGRFIKEQSKGQFVLASTSVEKVIAISCSHEYPVEVCSGSSRTVFNSVIGPDVAFEEKELHVSVTEKDSRLLSEIIKRLHNRLSTNKVSEIIQHPALRAPWFAKQFIKYLKREKHGLKAIFMLSDGKSGRSIFSLSLDFPYSAAGSINTRCFAEDLMMTKKWIKYRKGNAQYTSVKEHELLEKSCEMKWHASYLRLTDKLQIRPSKRCLTLAVNSGSNKIIEDLLTRQPSLTNDDWYLALRQAFEKLTENDMDTMRVIWTIKTKVELEYSSDSVESIIHTAAREGNADLLSKVITMYERKNVLNSEGKTCIHLATQEHHCVCVCIALENGVSQRIGDGKGELAIHYACREGFLDIAEELVSQDPDVIHCESDLGCTALHFAASENNLEISKFLLSHGASLNAKDKNCETPAHYAARSSKAEVLKLLLESELISNGDDLFAVVTKTGNTEGMDVLLEKQINMVTRQNLLNRGLADTISNWTASDDSRLQSVMHLLNKGADPAHMTEDGIPLVQLGMHHKCSTEIIRLLFSKGACVRTRNKKTGDTALHVAVTEENQNYIEDLLDSDNNSELLELRNNNGEIPLHIAAKKGLASIIGLLTNERTNKIFLIVEGHAFTALTLAKECLKSASDKESRQRYEDVVNKLSGRNSRL